MLVCKCNTSNDICNDLSLIDCKLAELGNQLYNNISYLLNNNVEICSISKLLIYKRMLTHKYNNPKYLSKWCLCDIKNKIKKITLNCKSKCCKSTDSEIIEIVLQGIYTNEFNNIFV